jgi:hypothetical protein
MTTDIVLAIVAAIIVAIAAALLTRPGRAAHQFMVRVRTAMSLRRHEDMWEAIERIAAEHEDMQRGIQRIAAELAMRRCTEEGNPDDEYRDDFYRWFTGDPDANVDYARKQQRDRERFGL